MPAANPFGNALEMKINTATPEELILMLYDGAIKFCNQAIIAFNGTDKTKVNRLILRVEDIIREFQLSLNHDYDISKNFNALYDYMYRRLVEANVHKDLEALKEVLGMLRELRDTWKEAMFIARRQQKARPAAQA
jgi:flagellar protein FliS